MRVRRRYPCVPMIDTPSAATCSRCLTIPDCSAAHPGAPACKLRHVRNHTFKSAMSASTDLHWPALDVGSVCT